MELTAVVHL